MRRRTPREDGDYFLSFHPEAAAKRPSKDAAQALGPRHPSRLVALAPQDEGNNNVLRCVEPAIRRHIAMTKRDEDLSPQAKRAFQK